MTPSWKNTYQPIPVSSLELDVKNPRTDLGGRQSLENTVQELLDENIVDLVESISTKGFAAVSIAMVVQEKGSNIVIDGNRRLLALKILNDPKLVKKFVPKVMSDADYEKINSFSKTRKEEVLSMTAVVYPSRVEAEREMSILHLEGEAVKKWKPLRQYRFFLKQLSKDGASLFDLSESLGISVDRLKKGLTTIQLFNLAKAKVSLQGLEDVVYNDKNFKTDKFQKTVVNEEGERFLGYEFDSNTSQIIVKDEKRFIERLQKILLELYNEKSQYFASAQYPIQNRAGFFKDIDPSFCSTKELKTARIVTDKKAQEGHQSLFGEKSGDVPTFHPTQERSDRKPSGLFSTSAVPFKLGNRQLQKLYDELKDPRILEFPNATHDLLRSFLECSLVSYLKHKNVSKYNDVVSKKAAGNQKNLTLEKILDYLADDKDSPLLERSVKTIAKNLISQKEQAYSVERMNLVNHNENWFSTEQDVRQAWEKIEPLFKIILKP